MTPTNQKALIVVDYQFDFITGSLAVPGAEALREGILHQINHGNHSLLVLSRDWHPADHVSFSETPTFGDFSWPPHCVQGTTGAVIDLPVKINSCLLVSKGYRSDREAYSAFQGDVDLERNFEARGITEVDVCGLALDYCVMNTALDAARLGLRTRVLANLTAPVTAQTGVTATEELVRSGVHFE